MAIIRFSVPTAGPGEDAAVKAEWYESADGVAFALLGETLLSALSVDPVSDKYVWELEAADTSKYQLIKTKSAGGVLSYFGALLPPVPDNPALQTLTGNVKEFGAATWSVGDIITLTIGVNQMAGGVVLEPVTRTVAVNANGLFSIAADKGAAVTLSVKYLSTGKVYFSKSFTVTTDSNKDLKDY